MSRFAVEQDPAQDSFAGLMKHLTRDAVSERTERESGGRALLPVAEVKAGRGNSARSAAPLSYEEALRIHDRRKSASAGEAPMPVYEPKKMSKTAAASISEPPSSATAKETAAQGPSGSASRNKRAAISAQARKQASQQPARASQPPDPNPAILPDLADSRHDRKNRSAGRSKKSSARSSTPGHLASKETKARKILEEFIPDKWESSADNTEYPGYSELSSQLRSDPNLMPDPDSANALATGIVQSIQPSQAVATSPLTQRRVIVSLRLTEGELARLRDRADESGITVSAYMRSCIVDADQLRAQVKQALTQMRAFSLRPEPDRFPALADGSQAASAKEGAWFRPLLRSAAWLLSPLFPVRRST